MAANNWIPIGTNSGASSDYSWTSIPAGYKELILRGHVQSATSSFMIRGELRVNGASTAYTASEYGYEETATLRYYADGTGTKDGGYLGYIGGSYLGSWHSYIECHLYGVSDSNQTVTWNSMASCGGSSNGYNANIFCSGLWDNSSTITQIDTVNMNPNSTSFMTLYGRK
tara:strand:+ start:237 stop:746 length:510 start_codon:yes stop_codon:yes gene_type:complete